MPSNVDIGSLISSRFDAMAAVSVKRRESGGHVSDSLAKRLIRQRSRAVPPGRIPQQALMYEIAAATERTQNLVRMHETEDAPERAVLVGLERPAAEYGRACAPRGDLRAQRS